MTSPSGAHNHPALDALTDIIEVGAGAAAGNLGLDITPVDWAKLAVNGAGWFVGAVFAEETNASPASLTRKDYVDSIAISAKTASYTLVLADVGKLIQFNSSSGTTLTVPTNASAAFPVNSTIHVRRAGTGTVTVAGSGVTLQTPTSLVLRTQWSTATLHKIGTDEWVLSGDLA